MSGTFYQNTHCHIFTVAYLVAVSDGIHLQDIFLSSSPAKLYSILGSLREGLIRVISFC
jgi:hypothetical protein